MKETVTIEDLQELQMEITKALQQQVLVNIGGRYQSYLDSTGFSIELCHRLKNLSDTNRPAESLTELSRRCY